MFHPYVFVLRNLVKPKPCLAFSTRFAFLSFSCVLLLNSFTTFGLFPKSLLLHKYSLLKLLCLPSRKVIFEGFCFSVYVEVAKQFAKLPQHNQIAQLNFSSLKSATEVEFSVRVPFDKGSLNSSNLLKQRVICNRANKESFSISLFVESVSKLTCSPFEIKF